MRSTVLVFKLLFFQFIFLSSFVSGATTATELPDYGNETTIRTTKPANNESVVECSIGKLYSREVDRMYVIGMTSSCYWFIVKDPNPKVDIVRVLRRSNLSNPENANCKGFRPGLFTWDDTGYPAFVPYYVTSDGVIFPNCTTKFQFKYNESFQMCYVFDRDPIAKNPFPINFEDTDMFGMVFDGEYATATIFARETRTYAFAVFRITLTGVFLVYNNYLGHDVPKKMFYDFVNSTFFTYNSTDPQLERYTYKEGIIPPFPPYFRRENFVEKDFKLASFISEDQRKAITIESVSHQQVILTTRSRRILINAFEETPESKCLNELNLDLEFNIETITNEERIDKVDLALYLQTWERYPKDSCLTMYHVLTPVFGGIFIVVYIFILYVHCAANRIGIFAKRFRFNLHSLRHFFDRYENSFFIDKPLLKTLRHKVFIEEKWRLEIKNILVTKLTNEDLNVKDFIVEMSGGVDEYLASILGIVSGVFGSDRRVHIPSSMAERLIDEAIRVCSQSPTLVHTYEQNDECALFSPIEGDIYKLLLFFNKTAWPSKDRTVILMGNCVYDAIHMFPCFLMICSLLARKKSLIVIRGPMENDVIVDEECRKRFETHIEMALGVHGMDRKMKKLCNKDVAKTAQRITLKCVQLFELFPIAVDAYFAADLSNFERYFIAYGGITRDEHKSLSEMTDYPLPIDRISLAEPDNGLNKVVADCVDGKPYVDFDFQRNPADVAQLDLSETVTLTQANPSGLDLIHRKDTTKMNTIYVNDYCRRHSIKKIIVASLPYSKFVSTNQMRTIHVGRNNVILFPFNTMRSNLILYRFENYELYMVNKENCSSGVEMVYERAYTDNKKGRNGDLFGGNLDADRERVTRVPTVVEKDLFGDIDKISKEMLENGKVLFGEMEKQDGAENDQEKRPEEKSDLELDITQRSSSSSSTVLISSKMIENAVSALPQPNETGLMDGALQVVKNLSDKIFKNSAKQKAEKDVEKNKEAKKADHGDMRRSQTGSVASPSEQMTSSLNSSNQSFIVDC